jgi:hypothetical protein
MARNWEKSFEAFDFGRVDVCCSFFGKNSY